MHLAGHTPAQSSQPMHFSIPSSYLLRTWRPCSRSGFGILRSWSTSGSAALLRFLAPRPPEYSVVTCLPPNNRCWRMVTANPSKYPIRCLLLRSRGPASVRRSRVLAVAAGDAEGDAEQCVRQTEHDEADD